MKVSPARELYDQYMDVRERGDREGLLSLLADDVAFVLPPSFAEHSRFGSQAVAAMLLSRGGGFFDVPTRTITVHEIVATRDTVVVRQRLNARTMAGSDYENEYCLIYRWEDGKIAAIHEFPDTLTAARIFGMV